MITIIVGAFGTVGKGLVKKTRGLGNNIKRRDNKNFSIAEIGQNTEKSPET